MKMMRSSSRQKTPAPEPAEGSPLAQRFDRRVRLSWLALLGERVWEALLWPFLVVLTFLVVSLLELWSLLPPLAHRILLGGFGLALVVSFLPLLRISLPTRQEALRRLERNAGIKHRPASSYEDRLSAAPPKETAALWAAHRERLSRLIARLRPSWPAPRTDRKDPYAVRAALLLGVVVAALAAGGNAIDRLRAAFSPAATSTTAMLRLDAWVTPPVYTGIAPIVLADGSEKVGAGAESFRALSVPERSELIVRTHAPEGETVHLVTSRDGGEDTVVAPKKGGSEGLIEFNVALNKPQSAAVEIGGQTVSKWRFDLIEDVAPTISLMGNPATTPRAALRLTFRADDDNSVASAEARFALVEGEERNFAPVPTEASPKLEVNPLLEPPVMPLQLPRANQKRVDGRATQDLTGHPWAGLKVRMTLIARDQAGQSGESQPYEFILPERAFTKPLARAVVEQRKKLVRDPSAPDGVANALDALTLGGDKVIDDSVVYLALRNAHWRLRGDRSPEAVASVVDQLWSTALRIEEGDLPEAERALNSAQDALLQALKEERSPEEIKNLVDELRSALSRYLQALASQQQENGEQSPLAPQDNDQLLSQQDLEKILNNIQQLAQSGSKDLAERMLSELKDLLERIETGSAAETEQQQRARRMMKDLTDLVSGQQKLLDDTFAAKRRQAARSGDGEGQQFEVSPPGQPMEFGPGMSMAPLFEEMPGESQQGFMKGQGESGGQGRPRQKSQLEIGPEASGEHGKLAERQQELRDTLQKMIDRFRMEGSDAPADMQDAGEAMGDAKEAIGESDLERATQQQTLALDRLRKGAESMAEQMMEGAEAQAGQGPGNNGRDPLGRPDRSNRPDLGLSVQVPDEIDIQRAREVLDELRRRLGDPSRPAVELDYLERLITPF
jgi:uncharacterized protein (TIGR02302 family)